ncbi:hypothetical protein L195_g058027, partial [Trifolium pratense]
EQIQLYLLVADQSHIQPDQYNTPTVQPSTSTHSAEIRELRVYTRKNKNQEGKEQQQIQHCLETNPSLGIENTQVMQLWDLIGRTSARTSFEELQVVLD